MRSFLLLVTFALTACSTPGAPGGSPAPVASGAASPAATQAPSAFTGTVTVSRDGTPLRVGPQFGDNDYGYTRDFTFGAVTVEARAASAADEVGVVWSDGNLDANSSNTKLRVLLKEGELEIQGKPGEAGTALMPGSCTKELSADRKTLVRYTYAGKMLDTSNGRQPTAASYEVTITDLGVARK